MADRALTSAAYTAPVPAETVSILTTDQRIALRREREHAAAPRWPETTVLARAGPKSTVLNERFDEIVGADQAVAGTALVTCRVVAGALGRQPADCQHP
jgi:hypothetical protein